MREVQQGAREAIISVVTEAELLVKPIRDADADAVQRIDDLLTEGSLSSIPVDRAIARRAATVRAELNLPLPDAFIVATAVEAGCDAIVGNDARCARRVTEIPYAYLDALVGP